MFPEWNVSRAQNKTVSWMETSTSSMYKDPSRGGATHGGQDEGPSIQVHHHHRRLHRPRLLSLLLPHRRKIIHLPRSSASRQRRKAWTGWRPNSSRDTEIVRLRTWQGSVLGHVYTSVLMCVLRRGCVAKNCFENCKFRCDNSLQKASDLRNWL